MGSRTFAHHRKGSLAFCAISLALVLMLRCEESRAASVDTLPPSHDTTNAVLHGEIFVGFNSPVAKLLFLNYAGAMLSLPFADHWWIALCGDVSGWMAMGSNEKIIHVYGSEVFPRIVVRYQFRNGLFFNVACGGAHVWSDTVYLMSQEYDPVKQIGRFNMWLPAIAGGVGYAWTTFFMDLEFQRGFGNVQAMPDQAFVFKAFLFRFGLRFRIPHD